MKTRSLFLFAFTGIGLVAGLQQAALARVQTEDQLCTFETKQAHYATLTSPAEVIVIKWHIPSGKVESFQWNQGDTTWYSYAADHGTVTTSVYYSHLDLKITRKGIEGTAYSIKGLIAPNVRLPAATFAGIYEGTGTAWFVGSGSLTCGAD